MMGLFGPDKYSEWTKPPREHYLKVAVIFAAVVSLIYPFESTIVPAWRLRVVDVEGNPCSGMQVNQGYKHYSLDLGAGDYGEYKFTDEDGYVEFPGRTIRASMIWRVSAPVLAYLSVIFHGSTGISGYVFASGMKGGPWLTYKPSKPLPDRIIVERCYRSDGV